MLGLYHVQLVVLVPFPLDSMLSSVSHNLPLKWELDVIMGWPMVDIFDSKLS